jgi:membrane-associated protein
LPRYVAAGLSGITSARISENYFMELTVSSLIDLFLHLDKHLGALLAEYQSGTYLILFAIVFLETGVVVTPFLPGDSLLFAAGALCSAGGLDLGTLMILLFSAAVLGDAANYSIGKVLGDKVFEYDSWVFKKKYLDRTQAFYQRYGGKTIIIARFVPIVRTFAPFLAGVGHMSYRRFLAYNLIGAALWVGSLTSVGYIFAENPFVKKNFSLVILAIIIISVLPAVFEIAREMLITRRAKVGSSVTPSPSSR